MCKQLETLYLASSLLWGQRATLVWTKICKGLETVYLASSPSPRLHNMYSTLFSEDPSKVISVQIAKKRAKTLH